MKKDLFIPLLILLVLTLGCSRLRDMADTPGNGPSSSNSNTSTTAEEPAPRGISPSGDGMADLKAASDRFTAVKAFQAKMDSAGQSPMNMELWYVAPDRFRIKNAGMESVIIGKDYYMNVNGKWRKLPMNLGESIPSLRDMFTEEGLKSIRDVEYAGDETVNGKGTMIYRYKGKGIKGGPDYTSRIWVAKDDGLPQKIEVEYTEGSLKTMSVSYEYKDVPIETPVQ